MKVDLIPEEIKLRKSIEERGKDLIKTGIFVLVNFILIFLILAVNIYFKKMYFGKLNKQYGSLGTQTKQLEKDLAKISMLKSYISKRGYPIEVLTELHNITPLDLELEDIRFDEQGKFSVKGTAETISTALAFRDSMEKSKFFKDVKTRYTTKRKEGEKDVADFEISCLLE
jgi:Tfp pilus assembly protein PilN